MAVGEKAPAWHRTVRAWLSRVPTRTGRATVVEVSVGRRSSEVLAALELNEGDALEDLEPDLLRTLEDLHASETSARVYTLRARRADRDPLASLEVNLPAPSSESSSRESPELRIIATLTKHTEAFAAQLVSVTAAQHTGYASVIRSLTEANRGLNEELNAERGAKRDAQDIAASAVSKLEELTAELAKTERDESKMKRLANALLEGFLDKKDPDGKARAKVVKLVKQTAAAELEAGGASDEGSEGNG